MISYYQHIYLFIIEIPHILCPLLFIYVKFSLFKDVLVTHHILAHEFILWLWLKIWLFIACNTSLTRCRFITHGTSDVYFCYDQRMDLKILNSIANWLLVTSVIMPECLFCFSFVYWILYNIYIMINFSIFSWYI